MIVFGDKISPDMQQYLLSRLSEESRGNIIDYSGSGIFKYYVQKTIFYLTVSHHKRSCKVINDVMANVLPDRTFEIESCCDRYEIKERVNGEREIMFVYRNIATVLKMLLDGYYIREIADKLGIKRNHLTRILNTLNVSVQKAKEGLITKKDVARVSPNSKETFDRHKKDIIRKLKEECNLSEIAERYNHSASALCLWMKERGIDRTSKIYELVKKNWQDIVLMLQDGESLAKISCKYVGDKQKNSFINACNKYAIDLWRKKPN